MKVVSGMGTLQTWYAILVLEAQPLVMEVPVCACHVQSIKSTARRQVHHW